MEVWELLSARVAWWFVGLHTEGLAFGESLQESLREPVHRLRFSSCPAFLTLASLHLYIFVGKINEDGVFLTNLEKEVLCSYGDRSDAEATRFDRCKKIYRHLQKREWRLMKCDR